MIPLSIIFAVAMMIPPPPGWQPPQAQGPGLYCSGSFALTLAGDERVQMDWPGEFMANDLYGTSRIAGPRGDVVVTENGPRSLPAGRARPAGRLQGQMMRRIGQTTYLIRPAVRGAVAAVTVRFPDGWEEAGRRAFLARMVMHRPAGAACLTPADR